MAALLDFLREHRDGDLLAWQYQSEAMARFGLTCGQVENAALKMGLLPARYQRNRQVISCSGQLSLFCSRVAVIGCGGLGGYVIEQLARLGVGQIVAVDPDIFLEHNLNRQLLSSLDNLGKPKVKVARMRIAEINPAVDLIPLQVAFDRNNGCELLAGVRIVVDALDSVPARLDLADICRDLNIPLVHGAIGGWYGHVATQYPGEDSLRTIYSNWVEGSGVEKQLGNPAFTPAVIASLQVAEVCKILLEEGDPLRNRQLAVDLLAMEFSEITFFNNKFET